MLDLAFIVVVEAILLGAVIILREPKLLVPCVVLGLPFEYLQVQTLGTLGEGGAGGAIRTMLNPGKAAMAATIVVAAWRCRHSPQRLIPNSSFLLPVVLLAAVITLGVAWSDSQRPPNAVIILPMYVAFVFAAPSLIEDRRDIERIVAAFLIAAGLVSVLAIGQRFIGALQWRNMLFEPGGGYRSNATFADPNNLARFLAITLALAAGTILATGPRRLTVYLAVPAVIVGLPALAATGSRSGLLGFLLAGFLMVMFAPVQRYTKLRLATFGLVGVTVGLGLLMLQGGSDFERIKSLTLGIRVLGQREFLIRAGWEMWKDNPFIGVGTGSYQNALVQSYLWVIPWWAETTLSHTSFISLLAEGGLVAISMLGFVLVRVANGAWNVYRRETGRYGRLMAAWCAVALTEIFFQSQSEGRLFEEPYLWAIFAIFVAVELGAARREPAALPVDRTVRATARISASRAAAVSAIDAPPESPPAPA
ncbi:MAG: O-antigen ligase family protein [Dehalococcoidia bacterium]|nr:O-antigen ligase family protein [Dehalococcoidia bacterium]